MSLHKVVAIFSVFYLVCAKDVCVVMWGLSRSAKITHVSFDSMILQPLRESGYSYRVYFHTWIRNTSSYTNHLCKEYNITLDPLDFLYMPANEIISEPEPIIDATPYLIHGDPWHSHNNSALYYSVVALISLKKATEMWREEDCWSVIYTRPDLTFLNKFNTTWLKLSSAYLLLPNHAQWPVNDRFAVGPPRIMKKYGSRLDEAKEFAKTQSLAAEKFLNHIIEKNKWAVKKIAFSFHRTRTSGYLETESFGGHHDF